MRFELIVFIPNGLELFYFCPSCECPMSDLYKFDWRVECSFTEGYVNKSQQIQKATHFSKKSKKSQMCDNLINPWINLINGVINPLVVQGPNLVKQVLF